MTWTGGRARVRRRGSGYVPVFLFGAAALGLVTALLARERADWARQRTRQASDRAALAAAAALQGDDYLPQATTAPGPALPEFLTARRAAFLAVYGDPGVDPSLGPAPGSVHSLLANLGNDPLGDVVVGDLRVGPGGLRSAIFAATTTGTAPPTAARVQVQRLDVRPAQDTSSPMAAVISPAHLRPPVAFSWAATAALTPAFVVGEGRLGLADGLPAGVFPLGLTIDAFAALAADPLTAVTLAEASGDVVWTDLGDPGRDAASIVRFLGGLDLPGVRPPRVHAGTMPMALADPTLAWGELVTFCGPAGQGRVAICPVLIANPPLLGVIGFARVLLHEPDVSDPAARTVRARLAPSAAVRGVPTLGELVSQHDAPTHPQLQHLYAPGCVARPWGVACAARLVTGNE